MKPDERFELINRMTTISQVQSYAIIQLRWEWQLMSRICSASVAEEICSAFLYATPISSSSAKESTSL
jgi:hypothetical protein